MSESTPVPSKLLDEAAEIIRHGWLPEIAAAGLRGDSPPEDLFVLALRTLLFRELLEGRMQLVRNAPLLDTSAAGTSYEVDVLLTQPLRGAELVVECQSYAYHAKGLTPARHAYETERLRALGRMRLRHLPFTGSEMLQPWKAALEVIAFINATFPEFAPIHIPEAVLSRARRYAAGPAFSWSPQAEQGVEALATAQAATRLPAAERLYRELPNEIILQARQISGLTDVTHTGDPSRAFATWSSAEEGLLREAVAHCQDTEVLAALLDRPGRAIAHRLARLGLLPARQFTTGLPAEEQRPA